MRATLRTMFGVAILIEALRVFLPSLITVYGRAGDTPAQQMGIFALAWFAAALVPVLLATFVSRRLLMLVAAAVLIVGRLGLQLTHGGEAQLYLAGIAVLGGVCFLATTAMTTIDMRRFVPGLLWGFALSTGTYAALDTIDLAWRDGTLPLALVGAELLAFLVTQDLRYAWSVVPRPVMISVEAEPVPVAAGAGGRSKAKPAPAPKPTRKLTWIQPAAPPEATGSPSGAARAWLAVGPALLLWGIYTGNTAHAQATSGVPETVSVLAVVIATFIGASMAANPGRRPWVAAGALVLSAAVFAFGAFTVGGVHGVAPWWTLVGPVVGALSLGACLGWAARTPSGGHHPKWQGFLLVIGLVLFIVLAFAYYAAYDLGIPNDYVPLVAALIIAGLALVRPGPPSDFAKAPLAAAAGVAVLAVFGVAFIPLWSPVQDAPTGPKDGLRVAAYNIRMGFGLDGTFAIEEQAQALRQLNAHVIVLSEVDRGWLLNGGHDDLRLLARRLGMQFVWAPAADEVWGDAVLTSLPIKGVRNHVLVKGGPTGAQALEVDVRWDERPLTIIATHLQPPADWSSLAQVEQLADIVRGARYPAIVAGDLNLEPGSPAWITLIGAGLLDPFADVRPFNTAPSPEDPQQIDHILMNQGFTGTDPNNLDVPYSDHRPIAVTLVPLKTK